MARPYAPTPATRQPAPAPAPHLSSLGTWAVVLPGIAVLIIASLLLVFVALPMILRSRCVAMAADRGVVLTLDHVAIGFGEIRLVKIGFSLEGVPQLTAHADDAEVSLSALTPADATVDGLTLTIDGPVEDVLKALDTWRTGKGAGTPPTVPATAATAEQKIGFAHGHLVWTRAFGQTAKIDAPDASGELDAVAGSLRVTAEQLSLVAGNATFGPWRTTLERGADGIRTAIELDPVVHGGPSVLYVRSPAGTVTINAKIPRSPLSRLGLPAKAMRLGSDGDMEAQIAFEEVIGGGATLTTSLALTHTVFSGVPVDATLKLRAAGDVTNGLDIKEGTLKAGPLNATVAGTVKLFDDGARLNLAWTARPVSCAEMGKELATQALGAQLGGIAQTLAQGVAGAVGLRTTGNATASGLITLDSRDVSATSFGMTANETCGIALF